MKSRAAKQPLHPDEIVFLKDNFFKLTNAQLCDHINNYRSVKNQYTVSGLRHKCQGLGLSRGVQIRWSEKDIIKLKAWYKILGDKQIAELLNNVGTSGGIRNGVKIKRSFTRKHIDKKRRLLGLTRTDEQIKNIVADNKLCGESKSFTKQNNFWTMGTKPISKENDTRIWKGRRYIKIDGWFIPYTRWFYSNFIGKINNGFIVFHTDMDTLNDEIDNLEVRKSKRLSSDDYKRALKLIEIRLIKAQSRTSRSWDTLSKVQKSNIMKDISRLTNIKEELIKRLNSHAIKEESKYYEPIEAF
ncbi:MAG: hypothetical protein A2X13_14580 [Bacteroidetes bacterium GWC2_33_15]|nr:MAG: hypothetical protein A2X10_12625 [Bacteroidetes bacterium GWA2_33_15]OFX50098.1 MAG: hypothetical protein A2X13_14580 [Bacteroidetes bacterium GWC2_33_15]OFX65251.1 MAG: hypothetical protein A2X15_04155 [Bacteroidetes bacterium GWB2_32_14]OFX70477.1 MAG: hypothetical protein A2X14_04210 [Bacteroidetes bacterium GWD2_33_33]HAN19650.1 hypothetical protein [Bacteroidales bacterium]